MKKFGTEVRLSREMTLMDVTFIGVGAMIGAGIFVLTGIAAGVAGPALILAFGLNGIVTSLTAMAYAELGSCFHDAGGGYLWVKEGLPKWNGFLAGWMSWCAHAVACGLYALGFGSYFGHVLKAIGVVMPSWGILAPEKLLAVGIAALFAYINFKGASETGKIGSIVTMAKILVLGVFIAFGLHVLLHRPDWRAAFTPFMPHGWGGVFKAMGLTFIAFEGYEIISQCSEEVKNPKRNIPLAIALSLLIVIPIYFLVAVAALGSVQPGSYTPWDYLALHKEIALVEVAKTFFTGGGIMLLAGGLVSTMSALNATIYSSSRVAFAMGRDRNFPAFFSTVHAKTFTPHWAILASAGIVVSMIVALNIEDVASAADIMFLLMFLQVNASLIALRRKRPTLDRGFLTPLFPWLSVLAIGSLLFLAVYMFQYSPIAWGITGGWIALGLGVYKGYASSREIQYVQKVQALERLERKEYRVLVCCSNPRSVKSLATIAMAIAKKHNAEIIFLHVIEVPPQAPLQAGLTDVNRVRPLLEEAERYVEGFKVQARTIVDVSHRISQGILETAMEERCNFIVLGKTQRPSLIQECFSSIVDRVIQRSPCEVAVLHGVLPEHGVHRILIPFNSDIHTQLAMEVTPAFIETFGATAQVVTILEPGLPADVRGQRMQAIQETIAHASLSASTVTLQDHDIIRGIVRLSHHTDLLIMGGRSWGMLEVLLGYSLSREITEQAACPVLWIKEYEEKPSLWSAFLTRARNPGDTHA